MLISIEIGASGSSERRAEVRIPAGELARVHLSFACPEKRNRSGRYLRRHRLASDPPDSAVGPDAPLRSPDEPPKLAVPFHLEALRQAGAIPASPAVAPGAPATEEPAMLAVPISDLVANLFRPAFHRDGLGSHRLFFLEGEPIGERTYWCLCAFERQPGRTTLELRDLRFDAPLDRALDTAGTDLLDSGLVWAAALVPLVKEGRALSAVEIARSNYDLRHIVGRGAGSIQRAYGDALAHWDARVEDIVLEHARSGKAFARFYHSILALDRDGNVRIEQVECELPRAAREIAAMGMVAAGVLDSGGSCALYDVWAASYLNHGWYFREPRGSILVFELRSTERVPAATQNSWIHRRRRVEECSR